ncbi:GNAT family N-acetyltransferase [Flavobacteriaceae bacterium KMM 6897]|nr:GNAT family N-acetyltransferase [Flavobacteriaceae bacterium KMM 6897]
MAKIQIRRASKKDAAYIALLGRVTFTETFGHLYRDKQDLLNYFDATFSVDKIENSLKKSNNRYWIATVDKLPVGYAKLKLNSSSELIPEEKICQLQKIYVLKDFLSLNIGYEMQNQLLAKAKEKKCSKVWLSVLISNDRAINFYRKNGFHEIGNHDFQIGKENFQFLVMSKQLN